jgi:hypothetical protein
MVDRPRTFLTELLILIVSLRESWASLSTAVCSDLNAVPSELGLSCLACVGTCPDNALAAKTPCLYSTPDNIEVDLGLTVLTVPVITFELDIVVSPCTTPAKISSTASITFPTMPTLVASIVDPLITQAVSDANAEPLNPATLSYSSPVLSADMSATAPEFSQQIDVPFWAIDLSTIQVTFSFALNVSVIASAGTFRFYEYVDICMTVTGLSAPLCGTDLPTCTNVGTFDFAMQAFCFATSDTNWHTLMGSPPYEIIDETPIDFSSACQQTCSSSDITEAPATFAPVTSAPIDTATTTTTASGTTAAPTTASVTTAAPTTASGTTTTVAPVPTPAPCTNTLASTGCPVLFNECSACYRCEWNTAKGRCLKKSTVTVKVVVSGNIQDFDQDAYKTRLAAAAGNGVEPEDIVLEISSASVEVDATIYTDDAATAQAASTSLSTAMADETAASSALGVAVVSIDEAPVANDNSNAGDPPSPPPFPPAQILGDPHFLTGDGGFYDFKGEDGAVYNLISHGRLSVNALFKHAVYLSSGGANAPPRRVQGSFLRAVYVVVHTDSSEVLQVAFDATAPLSAVFSVRGAPAETELATGNTFRMGGVEVSLDHRALTVQTAEWRVAATSRVKLGIVNASSCATGRCYLNVQARPLFDVRAAAVAPHGLLAQAFDGDEFAVSGAVDDYGASGRASSKTNTTSTSAMGEGAIEGSHEQYVMASKFATDFAFSRFGKQAAAPRTISNIRGSAHVHPAGV